MTDARCIQCKALASSASPLSTKTGRCRACRIGNSIDRLAQALGTCQVRRAYRSMADIGSTTVCGNPVKRDGYCLRHHPETKPKRDTKGRITTTKEGSEI